MNLQLIKIKKQNAFDYNLLSDFMKKKNGKLIFTAGFGNAGKISDNTKKGKLNLMQKFERKFQFHSIMIHFIFIQNQKKIIFQMIIRKHIMNFYFHK